MNELNSLLFYITLFIISVLFIRKAERISVKKETIINSQIKVMICIFIGLGIPILIAAIRYQVGTDYNNYIDYYSVYSKLGLNEILKYANEFLFILVIKIAYIFREPQILFAIMAFLIIYITYKSILNKREKVSITLMFTLYLFLYYTYSLNIIRQALAVALIAYSYKYIIEQNLKKFLLVLIIAILFHTSAIIFLPFYFISPKKNEKNRNIMFIIRIITIILVLLTIFNIENIVNCISNIEGFGRLAGYISEAPQGQNKQIIINTMILFILIICRKPLMRYDEDNRTYLFLYIIGFIFTLSGFTSPYIKRIGLYFNISEIYLLATLPNIVKKQYKPLVKIGLIIYGITIFILSTYVFSLSDVVPYQTIFSK